jgi:hypothetical protein
MFNKTTAPAIETALAEVAPVDLTIPLSHLSLDADEPNGGWTVYLTGRGIEVVSDHIGRSAISTADARQLLDERREAEVRAQEIARRQEQQAIEADQAWRAQLPRGVPWWQFPDGVSPADAWAQAEKDAQPKRRTLLEDAFAREETLVYHSLQDEADES